jgi:hypothetical protein
MAGMAILRAFIVGALMAGFLTGPVYAQQRKGAPSAQWKDDPDRERNAAAVDQQYKATLERTRKEPAQAPKDPWANLRDDSSKATKP